MNRKLVTKTFVNKLYCCISDYMKQQAERRPFRKPSWMAFVLLDVGSPRAPILRKGSGSTSTTKTIQDPP